MIHSVEFRNFKGLRHVKIDLERFTVLVGPNASGKTSILEGLYYLTRSPSQTAPTTVPWERNYFTARSRGAKGSIEIVLEADNGARKVVLSPPNFSPNSSPPSSNVGWGFQAFDSKTGDGRWIQGGFMQSIIAASLLRLDANQLASPSFSQEQEPRVGSDGQGLASALVYLLINRRDDFDRLLILLRRVCPYVEGIRFNRSLLARGWGEELVFDLQGAPDIPARMVSDGTLLVLGLLAVMMGPDHPKLILFDDLDHGLHPRAQRDLVALLRKLLDQDPDLQIVATSHSPYLLDQLEPKEVRLTTRLDDGSVACARLDEHPDFEKWKDAMTPGEFWSMVGEKWVGERQLEAAGS